MIGSNRHYPEEAPAHCGEANWVQIDLEKDDQNHLISPEERFTVAMRDNRRSKGITAAIGGSLC
jgi:hypothetical protein